MLTKKLYGIIGIFIILSNIPCQAAEHPFKKLERDRINDLVCAGEASKVAYFPPNTLSNKLGSLRKRGYSCVKYCEEKNGVFSVGFYNDTTNNLIVAHRGTVISEIDNLFADLGILESTVRESEYNKTKNSESLTQIPEHSAFTELLTRHVQGHIAKFLMNRNFLISSLGGADKLVVDRILNFNCLYNSTINTYQTGWGVLGTFLAGIGSIATAVAPPVGITMLVAGAAVGGFSGNTKAHSMIDGHLLEGRKTLATTLDIMYKNTKDIVCEAKKKHTGYENSLTVTGHSLGAAGALGVMARLESENYEGAVNSILFNAPGGHNGLVKIWSTHSRLRGVKPVSIDGNADHVKRSSCIVSSFGNDPVETQHVFDPLPCRGSGLSEWKDMLIPSHSINYLVDDMNKGL